MLADKRARARDSLEMDIIGVPRAEALIPSLLEYYRIIVQEIAAIHTKKGGKKGSSRDRIGKGKNSNRLLGD